MQNLLSAIQVLDELGDATLVQKLVGANRILPFVGEDDLKALVQKGELTQALGQRVVVELRHIHDGGVRLEGNLGARFFRPADFPQRSQGNSAFVILFPGGLVAPNFQVQGLGQRIHATYSDAVQTAGHFVTVAIELTTGMELGEHHLRRGDALFFMDVHRNATSVIRHGDRVVHMNDAFDRRGVPREGLVHGVVDHLIHQVMQPGFARGADVHRRPQPHSFQAFQDLDAR